jgi:hypothetical protein
LAIYFGIFHSQWKGDLNLARCQIVRDFRAYDALGEVKVKFFRQSLADQFMHIGRDVLRIHRCDLAIYVHDHMVLHCHECALVSIGILEFLHATVLFELST